MVEDELLRAIVRMEIKEIFKELLPEMIKSILEDGKDDRRKFAVLIDFENFKRNIEHPEEVMDFSWLTSEVREKNGEIVFGAVFFPAYLERDPALGIIIDIHGYVPILCLRSIATTRGSNPTLKSIDTVDNKMCMFGMFLLEHSDITDIAIITGDYDFQILVAEFMKRGRGVHIYSAGRALSGGFNLQKNSGLNVVTIDQ